MGPPPVYPRSVRMQRTSPMHPQVWWQSRLLLPCLGEVTEKVSYRVGCRIGFDVRRSVG